jgi:L-iditol 2-dehydrogenase
MQMRVGMYYNNRDVRVEEMPIPKIGPEEILVKVIASGICGSDVLEWYRIKTAPRVLGHEIAGDIVEVGEKVKSYQIGQRVFVSHHIPCNTCYYCLKGYHTACEMLHTTNFDPGGFAQYLRVPQLNVDRGVFVLPDEVTYPEGTFVEPLGCVLRGQRVARFQPGDSVLVLGAGISGLLHLAAARAVGAGRLMATDINEYRLNTAKDMGADEVLNVATAVKSDEDVPAWVRQVNNHRLADLVIVCTGALPAFKQALKSVDRGGTVLCFATTEPHLDIPVPMNEFWRNEIKLMPSYGNAPMDALIAIELIRSKRLPLEKMITHCLPMDQIAEGFRLVAEASKSVKVIIEPHR